MGENWSCLKTSAIKKGSVVLGAGEQSNCYQEEGPIGGRTGTLQHPRSLEVSRSPCLLRGGACTLMSSLRDPLGVSIGPAVEPTAQLGNPPPSHRLLEVHGKSPPEPSGHPPGGQMSFPTVTQGLFTSSRKPGQTSG